MKIKVIVVDDEPLARKGLLDYISDVEYMEIQGAFDNPMSAIHYLKDHPVDVIFLDINMPKMDGLAVAKAIEPNTIIIFTTAYREYAVESYDLGGFDYLVKPITFKRFLTACNRAFDKLFKNPATLQFDEASSTHFFIKEDGAFLKIEYDNILFIGGYKDFVKIHVQNQMHLALISLKSVGEKLPEKQFIRVHKSYIINKYKVNSINGNTLLINNDKIPIGKTYRDEVMVAIIGDNLWRREKSE